MRLILKLIAAPLILFLTVLVAVLLFLFSLSSFFLTAASVIMALLGVGLFFISYPVGGVIYLVIAFLLSPYGLQAVAGVVITGLDSLNLSLVDMGITPHTPTQNRTCAINAYGFPLYISYFIYKTNLL